MHDFAADFATLASRAPKGKRLMGLDLGTKTIGLATSDVNWQFATAFKTIRRTKFQQDAAELAEICLAEQIGGLVIGLPLNMNSSEGPRAQSTRGFIRNIAPIIPLPVAYADERLSTVAAERTMIEADLSRAKRAKLIDAAAAAFILQGALDFMRSMETR